ncbi:TspO/MBR family protein [Belliella kenyensis]|uniref:TspO/MBR family protein n=1 Tax=Belliella kenyensis TaxID=1472724 RepID=A0ABV8EMI8_9BACT|nr:TspO/MBR family protein [Belliella kenyensis]MCH7401581.1 tryptophan-rich sensory protein [Belliella kenyensis]MDN3603139.1 TspO/MBR family protein [Belliella kenyensis]
MKKWQIFIISLSIPLLAGFVGSLSTASSVNSWYATLEKPSFNPPSWLFAPVWTVLYLMIGVVLYILWTSDHPSKRLAIKAFAIQMILNFFWSPAFFGLESPLLGLLVILPLWVFILICIRLFKPISATASYMMVPYFLWVTFASLLNISIWYLN